MTAAFLEPVVFEEDERGIKGWESDQKRQKKETDERRKRLAGHYPKLSRSQFIFSDQTQSLPPTDINLSNRGLQQTASQSSRGVLPGAILQYLSLYQRHGVTFMYRLYERDRGGLLADAMGLGKTVQTICFLGAAFGIWDRDQRNANLSHPERSPRILVVTPASVRENWKREFNSWTPFRVDLYETARIPFLRRCLRKGTVDVVIAGHSTVANQGPESQTEHNFFKDPLRQKEEWEWDVIIVDEIHVAKNSRTKIYKALEALGKRVMFGLTGTAVQNKLKELWNVMSLVVPPTLWPTLHSFRKDLIDCIRKGTKKDASDYMKKVADNRIARLRNLLGKHMIRRPKSIIDKELPGKTDYCVLMRMKRDGLQGYMYQRFQNSYDVKLLRDANLPCDCGSGAVSKECCHRFPASEEERSNSPIWAIRHPDGEPCDRCPNCICLHLQHYSRVLAAHALLLIPEDDEPDPDKVETRMRLFRYYLGKYEYKAYRSNWELEQEGDVSCKLNVALRLLRSYQSSGHKAIVFYESLRLGKILQRWASRKGLLYEVIDGSVGKEERQGAVDRFNKNPLCSIFLISKKAGGTGLNICGADRVLIFEPCWNPTLDLQAGDRAHRLGQKRGVQIIRLVAENTIEHYVFKTAVSKSQVSNAILDNTKEEWRVRENEVGTMQAMLRMGDVFANRESQSEDIRIIEADDLNKSWGGESITQRDKGKADKPTLDWNSEEESDNPRVSSKEKDLLGDEIVCSLDVDVEADDLEFALDNHGDSSDEGPREKSPPPFIPSESQFETDAVLGAGGASNKFVMSSTSVRKRKRQVMGMSSTRRDSGINPEGPTGVNFDDAEWKDLPMSMETEGEDDEEVLEPIRKKRGSIRKTVTRSTADASAAAKRSQLKAWSVPERRAGRSRKPPLAASRPKAVAMKESERPKSAFAARARVRR